MPELAIEHLSVRYPARTTPALSDVSLTVAEGEVHALAGRTGAGKSTLALVAAGLLPRVVRASVTGSVRLDDLAVATASASQLAGKVGIVFSSPWLQLSASKPSVREELAFGLENLAVPRAEMGARLDAVLERLGISHLAEREPLTLSGGEQQRVAIASIVVMGTAAIAFDEPTAQLDPAGTEAIAQLLDDLAHDGRAVLVAEHSAEVLSRAGRLTILREGGVEISEAAGTALGSSGAVAAGVEPPTAVRLAQMCGLPPEIARDEQALAAALARRPPAAVDPSSAMNQPNKTFSPVRESSVMGVSVEGLTHRYANGVEAVRGVDLSINAGSSVAIVGQNGSGKTTLVKHLNGLLRPTAGAVHLDGRDTAGRSLADLARDIGFVFQNPDDQLFSSRVDREVAFGARNLRLDHQNVERLVNNALALTGTVDLRAANPYDLDISVRKLVALAGVLAMEPAVLVLDEPTMSQDSAGKERIGAVIEAWVGVGRSVVAITHDMEFAARHFARIVVMRQGEIILDGPPEYVFSGPNSETLATTGLRPPLVARLAAQLGLGHAPRDPAALLAALS